MDNSENRVTTFTEKKNRFETIHLSYEVCIGTPVVSVRSHRGENFTGKGISLQPSLWEKLIPEITKAIHAFKLELVEKYGGEATAQTAKKDRKQKRNAKAAELTT